MSMSTTYRDSDEMNTKLREKMRCIRAVGRPLEKGGDESIEESKLTKHSEVPNRLQDAITPEFVILLNKEATKLSNRSHPNPCYPLGGIKLGVLKRILGIVHKSLRENEHPFLTCARQMRLFGRGNRFGKQPFSDCNHRTSYLLADYVCCGKGYTLGAVGSETKVLYDVWEKQTTVGFQQWIEAHAVRGVARKPDEDFHEWWLEVRLPQMEEPLSGLC